MAATTQRIRAQLDQLPASQPVGFADFVREPAEFGAVAAALSRLSKRGELKRLAKGYYYRPVTGRFGLVPPAESAVVAAVGAAPGQPAPYPTGRTVYHALGLTTAGARHAHRGYHPAAPSPAGSSARRGAPRSRAADRRALVAGVGRAA